MKVKSISQRISVALLCLMLLTSLLPARALAADEGSSGQSEPERTALLADTADAVPYIDEYGNLKTCTNATVVTGGLTSWGASGSGEHWYVVNGDVPIVSRVTVNGDVHLILADGCNLTVTGGITVNGGNSLTIYAQSAGDNMGVLTATGDNLQAGIGGNNGQSGGAITINGGTVNATGGNSSAGIGGGFDGAGGNITINGGAVTANGGSSGAGIGGGDDGGAGGNITINGGTVIATGGSGSFGGAGIGGGAGYYSGGAGGNITINGGTVTATGNGNGAGIGGGASYRGGSDNGTFSTGDSGRAVIFASSIGDNTPEDWSGIIFQGQNGAVYGTSVTPTEDFTIPAGSTLTIDSGQTLTIPAGVTLTNKGTIVNNGTIDGTVGGNIVVDTYYLDTNNETQNKRANLVTTASTTWTDSDPDGGWYVVQGEVDINSLVTVKDDVHLILANGCNLTVNGGINVSSGNSLTIYGQAEGTGTLIANGGSNQAGIGGGGENADGGTITINGGTVKATGGDYAAGIGGGITGNGMDGTVGSGGAITINGGTVIAQGGSYGSAGIGGGGADLDTGGAGGTIIITGGAVTATGHRNGGAGIGGGKGGDGGTITISGGTVNANGGNYAADIGGGNEGTGGKIIISGGTVAASSNDGTGIGGNSIFGDNGTFSTGDSGRAVIFASSIDNQSYKEDWSGVIFEGSAGKVYGTNVAPAEDFTIPDGDTLTIEDGRTLTIPEGITLTNNGTIIVESGGAIVNKGTITGSGTIQLNGGSTVQTGNGPEMTLPGGGTIDPDTGAVTPGNGGSVVIGSGDNEITITPPAGESVVSNSDGSVTVPGGSIVTDSEGTKTTIPESGGTLRPDGSLSYSVTVTFDSQGGSEVASQTVTVGTAAARPDDPARSGYSFQGWYTAADGDTAWDFADPVQTDMTLYARWSQNGGGGSSGGGSSGGGTTTYPPTIDAPENGSVDTSPSRPKRGDTVTITAEPDDRYRVDQIIVTDRNGSEVEVTLGADGTYTFTQPAGKVEIEVTYAVDLPFTDVPEDAWYHEGVEHVYANYIMNGTSSSSFSPSIPVSRGMIMQILYNLAGQPDVEGNSGFTDVSGGYWGSDAIAWAVENGVAEGFGDGTFRPDDSLTREQMAVVLHNYAYRMGWDVSASGDLSGFTDIPEGEYWARDALAWAYGEGLITGTSESTMEPNAQTSRAQIAVIMMRFCERYAETVE